MLGIGITIGLILGAPFAFVVLCGLMHLRIAEAERLGKDAKRRWDLATDKLKSVKRYHDNANGRVRAQWEVVAKTCYAVLDMLEQKVPSARGEVAETRAAVDEQVRQWREAA